MRKTIFALFVALCVNNLFAQIQTEILGCKLGVSTKSSVERIIKSKGLNLIKSDATDALKEVTFYDNKDGVSFGGIIWDNARIRFVDGKFAYHVF